MFRYHSMWSTLTTSYHKAVPKMLRCVNLSITLKGIDGIIMRFWETAHLPLSWDNVNTYISLRAKCWLRGGVGIMIPINYREPARNKNSELWDQLPLPLSHMRLWWATVFFLWHTNDIRTSSFHLQKHSLQISFLHWLKYLPSRMCPTALVNGIVFAPPWQSNGLPVHKVKGAWMDQNQQEWRRWTPWNERAINVFLLWQLAIPQIVYLVVLRNRRWRSHVSLNDVF